MVSEAVAAYRGEERAELADVTIELPIDAHVPHEYVAHERLRLEAYAKIAAAADDGAIQAVREELTDRYGPVPEPVERLFAVASLRAHARRAGLTDVTAQGTYIRFAPVTLAESAQLRLKRLYPGTVLKPAVRAILVPRPTTARVGGRPLRDAEVLAWARELVDAVLLGSVAQAAATAAVPG
jgi:transcription-repair coupling factor (superfamily II helicase)